MMELVGLEETDIFIDENGQPQVDETGDIKLVAGESCWAQDIKNEMLTTEGELFYEDQESTEAYGYSLVEFLHMEFDEMTEEEIVQRIREKLSKREDIDEESIDIEADISAGCNIKVKFRAKDSSEEQEVEVDLTEIEVVPDD